MNKKHLTAIALSPPHEMTRTTHMEVRQIAIKNIDTTQQMVRKEQDDDHIIELANSISTNGLLEPIVVQQNQSGNYTLIAGFHRLEACKHLHHQSIPAVIRDDDEKTPIKSLALIENIMRRDLSLEEECKAIGHLYEIEKKSPSQICQLVGKSRQWVDRRLAAPHLQENIKEALFDGLISIEVAEMVQKVTHDGMRNSILQEAIYAKRTRNQVRDLIEIAESTPNMGEAIATGLETKTQLATSAQHEKACEACGTKRPTYELTPVFVCATGCKKE